VRGLKGFDPAWVVGSDSKDRRVRLGISVKLLARDKIQGARVEDLSPTLRGRLKWSLST
jgi:predicted component of type VI protein secretion system